MSVTIHTIPLGISNCYILRSEGTVLIDCGPANQAGRFLRALDRWSMQPSDIRLIVLTHGHGDHIGSAKEIRELCGAPVALHALERDALEKSETTLPPGSTPWGRLLVRIMGLAPQALVAATGVDIALGDAGLSLEDYGIPGEIVHTPGHTLGSVSVLLENGDAFVGDLGMNTLPLRLGAGLPTLAEDMEKVRESWRALIDRGAMTVYPTHGKPYPIGVIRRALA